MSIPNLNELRRQKAENLHAEAMRLSEGGESDGAIKKYLEALKLDQARPNTLYNLGLIYKYRKDWPQSLEYNQRAFDLRPDDEATAWNLAIAATALRRWDVARKTWTSQGIAIEAGVGAIEMDFGLTPVRLAPDSDGEVVWAQRIDPVCARIENVPLPESGFRCGDIVLHDGASAGYRRIDNTDYPVFNVLEIMEPSMLSTFRAKVRAPTQTAIEQLQRASLAAGIEVEDWTSNIQVFCRQCSEGRPHREHDTDLDHDWSERRILGISAPEATVIDKLIRDWVADTGSMLLSLRCELNATQSQQT